ncbi:MAG: hypothetical protein JO032_19285 [Alphaproteobacteria bacterium]|nr:hypothetical protein [Alphaproteobacteria bacterium]MBV9554929.1 hypothetical protein [Alphaproteobacteria bacterium]
MSSLAVALAEPALTAAFTVHARAEPGVLPRLLELFAKRGLVPERWHSTVVRPAMKLAIDIEMRGLETGTVEYVANCMRRVPGVELVLTA